MATQDNNIVSVFGPGALRGNTSDFNIKYTSKEAPRKENQPFIMDLESGETLFLQGLPMEINHDAENNFSAIKAMGRNNPLYHFTGSEDSVKFTISWYSQEKDKEDVLRNCKWLYSKCKNNGLLGPPPLLTLSFGRLFRGSKWLLTSANFTTRLFDRSVEMLPKLATQNLEFKRVKETNITRKDYLSLDL